MAEYIEKQAAINALEEELDYFRENQMLGAEHVLVHHALCVLDIVPPADVRPVVLCDDCRWFADTGYSNPDPEMPMLHMGYCRILGRDVQACWFCATGERGDADGSAED